MSGPSPRPWRIHPEPVEGLMPDQHGEAYFWVEAAPEPRDDAVTGLTVHRDRRVICEFRLYGDDALDREAIANAELLVRAVNALDRVR